MKYIKLILLPILLWGCTVNSNPKVKISTTMGDIVVEIYSDKAPITANNFLAYVDSNKYSNLASFYRVVRLDNQPDKAIKIEVVQGGFYSDSVIEKRQFPPIVHETTQQTGILHLDGAISMARMEPGSASSEFFICIGNQPELDFGGKRNPDGQGFAAFGKVISGMEVVRQIQHQKDNSQYLLSPIKINSIIRL